MRCHGQERARAPGPAVVKEELDSLENIV